jgi:DNA-nicking Smr family endonuclease
MLCDRSMTKKRRNESAADSENHPFSQLASLVRKARIELHPKSKLLQEPSPAPAEYPMSQPEPADDDQLFERAMEGVDRVSWLRDPAPTSVAPAPHISGESELEDVRLLQEAVDGKSEPAILDHPEYIEGWVGIAGRRFLANLRSGVYSIQGFIDLHGLSRIEARSAVEDFIIRMSRERSCCVKIVHGRGINSPSDKAVLKEHLQRWLATRRMSRHVVAYASAPYVDGGVGAVYVLLRRVSGR